MKAFIMYLSGIVNSFNNSHEMHHPYAHCEKKSLHKDINTKVKPTRIPKVVRTNFHFFQLLVVV